MGRSIDVFCTSAMCPSAFALYGPAVTPKLRSVTRAFECECLDGVERVRCVCESLRCKLCFDQAQKRFAFGLIAKIDCHAFFVIRRGGGNRTKFTDAESAQSWQCCPAQLVHHCFRACLTSLVGWSEDRPLHVLPILAKGLRLEGLSYSSDIEVYDFEGVVLDELAARFDVFTHQRGENVFGRDGVLELDLQQRSGVRVHRGFP